MSETATESVTTTEASPAAATKSKTVKPKAASGDKKVAKKVAAKTAPKKAVKTAKKTVKKAAKPAKEHADRGDGTKRDHDVPWNAKKVAVFKALKALNAVNATAARSAGDVVKKANGLVSERDVRHYVYHAMASGLANVASVEGIRGYAYFLTAKGAALDPAAELKKQQTK